MRDPAALPGVIACDCGGETAVCNVRGRVNRNVIWRQRKCKSCGKLTTTFESRVRQDNHHRADQAATRLLNAVREAKAVLDVLAIEQAETT